MINNKVNEALEFLHPPTYNGSQKSLTNMKNLINTPSKSVNLFYNSRSNF